MTTIEKILYQIKIDKLITFSEILKFSDIFLNAKQGFISRTNHKYPALFMEIIEWQIIDHAISAAPEFEKESSLIPFFDAIEKIIYIQLFSITQIMKTTLLRNDENDKKLIKEALGGSRTALELLLKRHYNFIYNVAFRFVFNLDDAQDLTQDVIIKVITNLSQFNEQSNFQTWLYRIVCNHFLNTKKRKMEFALVSFDEYGEALGNIFHIELNKQELSELQDQVEDAKIGCMTGMLLCLEREQRLVYTLGEIFEIESKTGAEFLNISSDNFRQILSRARKTLYNFMNNKCGLVNTNNPCRCHKKTKGFIQAGWVNENNLHFNNHFVNRISAIATTKSNQFDNWMDEKYGALFKEHPYYDMDKSGELINQLIGDNDFQKLFELNQ